MQQIIRYGLVGVATNALAFGAYLLLTWLGVPPKTAMTLVYLLAAFAGYWGNRQLTFAHRGSVLGSGARYVLAHGMGYAVNWTLLAVGV
ncbi:GtrA family protein, partial [Nocardioides sp.]|uniref:GtrA family protein n=1 Tax=Nocardioides sp. TaxID=35761 RepID=UPI002733A867